MASMSHAVLDWPRGRADAAPGFAGAAGASEVGGGVFIGHDQFTRVPAKRMGSSTRYYKQNSELTWWLVVSVDKPHFTEHG
jgi:hypothetical protein